MKTYTKKEVNDLLKKQVEVCSIIPKLNRSASRSDKKEWNKFLNDMSKAIKATKIKL